MLKILCSPIRDLSGSETVYAILEYAMKREIGGVLPEIKKTPAGKPFFPDMQDVHFSLSHTRTHVLCAISSEPVGVDIESERQISEKTIRFFSTPEELSFFDPLDLWVLKESYIKLVGGRLILVKSISFSYENCSILTPDKVALSQLYRIENCRAAVSSYRNPPPDSVEFVPNS